MVNKINGIDFVEQIRSLKTSYQSIINTKNFLDDNRSQFRQAVEKIAYDEYETIYHDISKTIKEAEKSLLIACYTIAEQMLKETKYQLLDFDKDDESRLQKFLNYKLEPEKFSPNPKCVEINKFFKRYGSSKLFLNDLELYDEMITCRHIYAHKGIFQFDINNIPKLIDILLYLEFEYRMFLEKSSWCIFLTKVNKIISEGGTKEEKQNKFKGIKNDLEGLILQVLALPKSDNILCNLKNILNELKDESEFVNFETKLNKFKMSVRNQVSL